MNSFKRVNEMRELINNEQGMYCLNGTIVEIDGVKFGGCDSWYSSAYLHINKSLINPTKEAINELWMNSNNDSRYIYGIINFDDIYKLELKKIERIYKECDVMITHINPSCFDKHILPKYRNQASNTFFTFNIYT